jgi:CDP-L-myo-inositol myo-inositolphosphotransferase
MDQDQSNIPCSCTTKESQEEPEATVQHAVIIAAGSGIRFDKATHFCPKPLLDVAGVPLITRTIRTAQKAGIRYFTVVTGYRAEVLESFLRDNSFPRVEIECVRNEQWRRANGLSVLRARETVSGRFLLLMADHLFEPEIITKVVADPLPPGHCRLAVDFRTENILDLDDATKVQVVDNAVVNIGKHIPTYNAIDTGIFLCSQSLFTALEAAVSRGEESLSDGVRELARNRRMAAVDIGDLFWQDVDNTRDLAEGERRLLDTLGTETDSWLTRTINRRISLVVTRLLARTRIRANHITLFNFCLALLGASLMLEATYRGFVLASLLFLLSSILDGCDGEIARLKFQESRLGAWLDVVTDNIAHLVLFVCMTIGLFRWSGSAFYLALGGLLVAGSGFSFLMAILVHRRLSRDAGVVFSERRLHDIAASGGRGRLALWLDRFANRDFAYLLLFLSCINRPGWFLWIAGLGAPVFGFLFHRAVFGGDR